MEFVVLSWQQKGGDPMRNHNGRVLLVLAFACAAMVIMAAVTPLAMTIGNKWIALGAAAAMTLAAIPVHLLAGHKRPHPYFALLWILCYLMNSVANGLSIAAFYIHAEHAVKTGELLQGTLPAMAVMAVAAAGLLCFPARKKLVLWTAGILAAVLVAASWIPAVWDAQPQRSMMLFGALTAIFYLVVYGRIVGREDRILLREISFGSFGALIIITLVVLVIITDGDALDFADIGGGDSPFANRKKKRV